MSSPSLTVPALQCSALVVQQVRKRFRVGDELWHMVNRGLECLVMLGEYRDVGFLNIYIYIYIYR